MKSECEVKKEEALQNVEMYMEKLLEMDNLKYGSRERIECIRNGMKYAEDLYAVALETGRMQGSLEELSGDIEAVSDMLRKWQTKKAVMTVNAM